MITKYLQYCIPRSVTRNLTITDKVYHIALVSDRGRNEDIRQSI